MIARLLWAAVLLAAAFCFSSVTHAKSTVLWGELSPEEQRVLEPLKADWDSIDSDRQRKWRASAKQYPKLRPEQQTRFQTNMREWARMSPEQRAQARQNFKQLKQLPPEQKQVAKQRLQERHGFADQGPVPLESLKQNRRPGQRLTPSQGEATATNQPVAPPANPPVQK